MTDFDAIRPLLEATDEVAVTPERGEDETYDGERLASMFETIVASDVTDLATWTVTDADTYPSLSGTAYTITVEATGQTIDYDVATDRYHDLGRVPGAAIDGDDVFIPVNGEPSTYTFQGAVDTGLETHLDAAVYDDLDARFGLERTTDG